MTSVSTLLPYVRRLAKRAEERATNWALTHEPTVADLLEEIPGLVTPYASTAAVLAADWYDDLGSGSYFPTQDLDLPEDKVANVASWVMAGPQLPESRLRLAANKLVFDAARRTILVSAEGEGVPVARHEEAQCCNKCMARATTWEIERTSSSHTSDQWFHPSCEGMYVPVRDGAYEPPSHARSWHERVDAARRAGNVDAEDIAKWLDAH